MKKERKNLFLGLEQILTSIKVGKSETRTKHLSLLDESSFGWIFSPREEDFSFDDILEYDGPIQPDDQEWEDLDTWIERLRVFISGEKDISTSVINIMEALLATHFTEAEIEALIYNTGKLFARYSDGKWLYHGEKEDNTAIYNIIMFLPAIHEILQDAGSDENYTNLIDNMILLLDDDSGLLNYMIGSMESSCSSELILKDLHDFLSSDLTNGSDAVLWQDISSLLIDLSDIVDTPPTPEEVSRLYKKYGFQMN